MKTWFPKVDYIWKNGELIPWDDSKEHVLSHGAMYGTGVFEGLRCYETVNGSALFRLGPHMTRLVNSAKLLRIPLQYSAEEIGEAIKDTIRANNLTKCYVRPLVSFGYHSLGVHPKECPVNTIIAAFPWDNFMSAEAHSKGISCCISSWVRVHAKMIPSNAKACGPYLNNMLAKIDATDNGYDEAIMLDDAGYVAEACTENLFIVKDGIIYTPGLQSSILPGITRDSVIQIAIREGYKVVERDLAIGEVLTCDELFLTGSAAEITPVREINKRIIGDGTPGPITTQIQQKFTNIVKGLDKDYKEWLEFVEG